MNNSERRGPCLDLMHADTGHLLTDSARSLSMQGICNWAQLGRIRRFLKFVKREDPPAEGLATLWSQLRSDDLLSEVKRQQGELVLMEKATAYAPKTRRTMNGRFFGPHNPA